MIFVTVGTDSHDFSRLVREMDDIAQTRQVTMQIGNTLYIPRHADWFRFESEQRIARLYRTATTVVTHAGAGSIIRCLAQGKVPVVVPRLRRFGEHVNDHQLDIARALGRKGVVVAVEDIATLQQMIGKKTTRVRQSRELAARLKEVLRSYEKQLP